MVIKDVNIKGSLVKDIMELSVLPLQIYCNSKLISKQKV